jgi:hypothetical protein
VIETIEISSIIREKKYQVRNKLDDSTVRKYSLVLLAGHTLPPILIAKVGNALYLVDGWHRVKANEKIGCSAVQAEIVETTELKVGWLAAVANTTHGLPLKSSEMRKVFRAYIKAGEYIEGRKPKSYREIARDLGGLKSPKTIWHWMKADFPRRFDAMRRFDEGHAPGDSTMKYEEEPMNWLDANRDELQNVMARYRGNPEDTGRRNIFRVELQELLQEVERDTGWTGGPLRPSERF